VPPAARTLLFIASIIIALQALAFVVLAVLEAANIDSGRIALGVGVTGFFLVFAAAIGWGAWQIANGEGRARSPMVFVQLISLGLAWNFRVDSGALAAAVAIPAVIVMACLLAPPVTRALTDDNPV
jgi:TRAP-type C4-dicarboxylate transport system permease small subunit